MVMVTIIEKEKENKAVEESWPTAHQIIQFLLFYNNQMADLHPFCGRPPTDNNYYSSPDLHLEVELEAPLSHLSLS